MKEYYPDPNPEFDQTRRNAALEVLRSERMKHLIYQAVEQIVSNRELNIERLSGERELWFETHGSEVVHQ